jgi:hypothetical protein
LLGLIPKLYISLSVLLGLFLIAPGLFLGETFFLGEADLFGPDLLPEEGFL